MKHALKMILVFVILAGLSAESWVRGQGAFTGQITFVHEDSGSSDPALHIYNLKRFSPNNPDQRTELTRFSAAPTIIRTPVWSKDYKQLAFSGNLNSMFSLESYSIFAMNADGSKLSQTTGSGTLVRLSGPKGTVVGRVTDPRGGFGSVSNCVVTAQGMTQVVPCRSDGSFVFENVPVGTGWIRAQGSIRYPEDTLSDGPGLSMGFRNIQVKQGQVTNAGTIVINPYSTASLEPSWSSDGKQVVVTYVNTVRTLATDSQGKGPVWKTAINHALAVWGTDGAFVRNLNLANLPIFQLAGADWSPSQNLIACGAIGGSFGQYFLALMTPEGVTSRSLYQVSQDASGPEQIITQCRWSPEGKRVAFVQVSYPPDGSPAVAELFIINSDSTGLRRITTTAPGQFITSPSWSPDGQFLAFDVAEGADRAAPQRSDIFAVNVGGGGIQRLTEDGRSYSPAWGK